MHAVLFDLDGTLLDRHRSFELFARDQWVRFASVLHPAGQDEYVRTLIEHDREGYGARGELFTGTVAQFALPSALADTLLKDYRASFANTCVLFPDARATLVFLTERAQAFEPIAACVLERLESLVRARLSPAALTSLHDSLRELADLEADV